MLTEEQIQDITSDAFEKIRNNLVESMTATAEHEMRAVIKAEVGPLVREFFQTEIAPNILSSLEQEKSNIIAGAIKSTTAVSDLIAQGIVEIVTENMSSAWSRKKIIEALFYK